MSDYDDEPRTLLQLVPDGSQEPSLREIADILETTNNGVLVLVSEMQKRFQQEAAKSGATEEMRRSAVDMLKEIRGLKRTTTATAQSVQAINASLELYLPQAHLAVTGAKASADLAVKRAEDNTAEIRRIGDDRETVKMHFVAQILKMIRDMNRETRLTILLALFVGAGIYHFLLNPVVNPVAEHNCVPVTAKGVTK